MSTHIGANKGEIAETVLLAGDPLRAEYVAKTFLDNVVCYNTIRNMLGYTGTIKGTGRRISVQGSGMGMPSLGIYVHELIVEYKVERIIRIGSAGSLQSDIKCRDIVVAQASCTDSALNYRRFNGMTYAPTANWELLIKAHQLSKELNIPVHFGNIFATDEFYDEAKKEPWKPFSNYNVLAVEMESAELYTLAALYKIKALTLLTISDNLITGERLNAQERQNSFSDMMRIALAI